MMNADLHCHSTVSDGQLAPAEVAARAHAGGVTLWALTDHDQLGGQREAREAAQALGMGYLGGVEISVTWAGRTVHIVGLNVDAENQALPGRSAVVGCHLGHEFREAGGDDATRHGLRREREPAVG